MHHVISNSQRTVVCWHSMFFLYELGRSKASNLLKNDVRWSLRGHEKGWEDRNEGTASTITPGQGYLLRERNTSKPAVWEQSAVGKIPNNEIFKIWWRALYVRRRILNSILNLTGSQWREAKTGETWSLLLDHMGSLGHSCCFFSQHKKNLSYCLLSRYYFFFDIYRSIKCPLIFSEKRLLAVMFFYLLIGRFSQAFCRWCMSHQLHSDITQIQRDRMEGKRDEGKS